jgi:hypothetical protein
MQTVRDTHQRKAYAARRASQAVDRMIRAQSERENAQARVWANLWGCWPGIRPPNLTPGGSHVPVDAHHEVRGQSASKRQVRSWFADKVRTWYPESTHRNQSERADFCMPFHARIPQIRHTQKYCRVV